MKNLTRSLVAFLALLAVAGCAGQKQVAAPGLLNSKCAVSGDALGADAVTADYMGGKVGFCCDKCAAKFAAMDEAGKKTAFDKNK
ncbi:MAG: hypothetical protein JNK15_17535 [Planctomycetes bacterium]|nr:hypothetical protein [Planctomycetota bacterium]